MATEATLLKCLANIFPANKITGLPALMLGEDEYTWGGEQVYPRFICNLHSEDPWPDSYTETAGFPGLIWGRFALNIWTQDPAGGAVSADTFASAVMHIMTFDVFNNIVVGATTYQLGAGGNSRNYRERYNCRSEGRDSQENVIYHATIRYRVEYGHSDH